MGESVFTETTTNTVIIQMMAYSTVTTTLGGHDDIPAVVFTVEVKATFGDIITWGLLLCLLCAYVYERGSARLGRMIRSR